MKILTVYLVNTVLIYGILSSLSLSGQSIEMKISVFDYGQTYVEPVIMNVQIKNSGSTISNFFPMKLETYFKPIQELRTK